MVLIFSANLVLAHAAFIKYFPLDVLMKYADALKEAGARRIDIYTNPAAWAQNDFATIAKYKALIEHIRKIGLEIAISPDSITGNWRYIGFLTVNAVPCHLTGKWQAAFGLMFLL